MKPIREEAGNTGTTGGSGAGSTPPAPQTGTPPAGQTPPPTGQAPAPTGQTSPPEGFVPAESLRAVTAERDALKRAAAEADEQRAKDQGRWQEVAEKREAEAKAAVARFEATARRAAFVSKASTEHLTDPAAAYKLALADGLLTDVTVTDDGDADEKAITTAVKAIAEKYAFLKPDGSFGQQHGQQGGAKPPPDTSKMSAQELLSAGYAAKNSGRT